MAEDEDVELLGREAVFRGHFTLERVELRHRRHDGGWSAPIRRELFDRGHAAAVLPYDPVRDEVVLIEQFRVGPWAAGDPSWMVEAVAGLIEDGENHDAVVRREAQEEAGITIGPLIRIGEFYVSPGATTERVHLFCGRTDARDAGGIHGIEAEGEDIRSFAVAAAELPAWLAQGRIRNLPAAAAVQWLLLHKDEVRAAWR